MPKTEKHKFRGSDAKRIAQSRPKPLYEQYLDEEEEAGTADKPLIPEKYRVENLGPGLFDDDEVRNYVSKEWDEPGAENPYECVKHLPIYKNAYDELERAIKGTSGGAEVNMIREARGRQKAREQMERNESVATLSIPADARFKGRDPHMRRVPVTLTLDPESVDILDKMCSEIRIPRGRLLDQLLNLAQANHNVQKTEREAQEHENLVGPVLRQIEESRARLAKRGKKRASLRDSDED